MRLLSEFPIKVISNGALVAITLMIAESNADEKDIMTTLVMNLLKMQMITRCNDIIEGN